jgi:hypothetical protein
MADTIYTLANLLVVNDKRNAERNVSDVLNDAPLLRAIPADTRPGTTHQYTKEKTAPVVGFRAANAGLDHSASTDELVTVEMFIVDPSFSVDKAIADGFVTGRDAFLAREGARSMRAAFFGIERQILYGTVGGAPAGFVGIADVLPHKDSDMVVDAGGATPSTGSSVFAIRATSDFNGACVVAGQDGKIDIADPVVIQMTDGDSKKFPGYYVAGSGWLCLQIGSAFDLGRICNLTAEDGHGLTDDLIAAVVEKFPESRPPTHLAMNRRSLFQLRASRTAVNATGAPAPIPTEWEGIPIISTGSVVSTETILVDET